MQSMSRIKTDFHWREFVLFAFLFMLVFCPATLFGWRSSVWLAPGFVLL